jgi:uncharacterized membrane protein YcaP (DUF421 family)
MIAALAVVVGGGFLMFGSRAVSHLRLAIREARQAARAKVSPERELARLRMELERDKDKDRDAIDKIVRLGIEVKGIKDEVAAKRTALATLDRDMKTWETALDGEGTTLRVNFNDNTKEWTRAQVEEQLRADARRLINLKNALSGREALLKIKQETLTASKAALASRQTLREKNLAKLQQIENALLEERLARERGDIVGDDGSSSPLNQDIKALDNRVKTLTATRTYGVGDAGPIRGAEAQAKPDTEVDNLLKARRNSRTAPVATNGDR